MFQQFLSALFLLVLIPQTAFAQPPALKKGDRIIVLGDTFADKLRADGYVEAQLAARHPELELVFQTLGWSGDTLTRQPRPLNFGSQDEHLKRQAADVVLLCFGMSESLNAPKAANEFGKNMTLLINHLRQKKYNGKSPPRLLLVTPIAHEQINSRLGDAKKHNIVLKEYVAALRKISEQEKIPLIDLFDFTSTLMTESASQNLTTNGIHLNAYGYWAVSHKIADALVGNDQNRQTTLDASSQRAKKTDSGFQFQIQEKRLPLPLPPHDAVVHPSLEKHLGSVAIKNLNAGSYKLVVNGITLFQGDPQQFADSFRIPKRPAQKLMRELRTTIQRKDLWFFARYRPVNTEYVFGRRTQPYGINSFPPEMKKMDELIKEQNQKIHTDANQPIRETWKLIRVK